MHRPLWNGLLPAAATLVCAHLMGSCTDRDLYGQLGQEPKLPDKLSLDGVLCTDNPATRRFPVRILFIVDGSGLMQEAAPNGEHVRAIQDVVNNFLPLANVEVGVIKYADRPESLIQEPRNLGSSGFTRDDALVEAALSQLRTGGGVRDFAEALSLARSLVTGDAFQSELGPLSRTRYVVVHVTTGAPDPEVDDSRCMGRFDQQPPECEPAFLDLIVRETRDEVLGLGAAEFNFHTVFLEPAHVEGASCDPTLGAGGQCMAGLVCIQTGDTPESGRCIEACDPANPVCAVNPLRPVCATTALPNGTTIGYCARGELNCFDGMDNDGDGQDVDCADPSYPYDCSGQGGCEVDCRSQCRLDRIATTLSLATGGRYDRYASSDQVVMNRIDFGSSQQRFVLKEFIVNNRNALPSEFGLRVDTDGDGLSDAEEDAIRNPNPNLDLAAGEVAGLDALSADTDGDFYNDRLEQLLRPLGLNPFLPDTFPTCDDPTVDRDGDGLRDCEEDLLGTDATLFDTDADGFPDPLEFRFGTNPIFNDNLDDADLDGANNGRELRANSDPLSNDAQVRAELAYRYRTLDLGPTNDARQCYDLRISNITLVDTRDQGFGPGFNEIDVYFGQVPFSALEGFPLMKAATVRVQYLPPDTRIPDTPTLDLLESDFLFVEP